MQLLSGIPVILVQQLLLYKSLVEYLVLGRESMQYRRNRLNSEVSSNSSRKAPITSQPRKWIWNLELVLKPHLITRCFFPN